MSCKLNHYTISADKSNIYDNTYLNCQATDLILQILQTVYLDNGTAFAFSRTRQRYDKEKYVILEPDHPNQ